MQDDSPQSKLEQVATGELFRQDEQAVIKITDGFMEALSGMNRFQPVRTAEKYKSNGTKNTFPTPLDWNTVSEICKRHQTDALLAFEIFDTDFIMANNPIKIDTKDEQGVLKPHLEFKATGVAIINFGIRLYMMLPTGSFLMSIKLPTG
jgi:hypothetical protein